MTYATIETSTPIIATDWTIPQLWEGYSQEQHAAWDTLFA